MISNRGPLYVRTPPHGWPSTSTGGRFTSRPGAVVQLAPPLGPRRSPFLCNKTAPPPSEVTGFRVKETSCLPAVTQPVCADLLAQRRPDGEGPKQALGTVPRVARRAAPSRPWTSLQAPQPGWRTPQTHQEPPAAPMPTPRRPCVRRTGSRADAGPEAVAGQRGPGDAQPVLPACPARCLLFAQQRPPAGTSHSKATLERGCADTFSGVL